MLTGSAQWAATLGQYDVKYAIIAMSIFSNQRRKDILIEHSV